MSIENKKDSNNNTKSSQIFLNRLGIRIAIITSVVLVSTLLIVATHLWLMVFASILVAIMIRGIGNFIIRILPLNEKDVNDMWKVGSTTALLAILITLGVIFLGPRLESQVDDLYMRLPDGLESLEMNIRGIPGAARVLDALPDAEEITNRLSNTSGFGTNLISGFTGIVSTTIGFLLETFIVIVVGFYLAINPSLYVDNFVRLFPKSHRSRVQEVLGEITITLRMWLLARGASVIVVIILTMIGLMIMGMPLVLTLAIIAGVFSFIPNLGPIIGAVPAIIVASSISLQMVLFVIGLYILIQTIESYFITPTIQQYTLSLPPVIIIMSQIFAAIFLGFLGVFLAAPLVAMIIVIVKELYIKDVLGEDV